MHIGGAAMPAPTAYCARRIDTTSLTSALQTARPRRAASQVEAGLADELCEARGERDGHDDAGRQAPSGSYHFRLEAAGESRTMRMMLLK